MITEMVRMDIKSHTLRSGHTNHLTLFEKTVQKCGVSFKIWEKKDGNGKNSGHYDWTSLPVRDKKILLKSLPPKLGALLNDDIANTVIKVWTVGSMFYTPFISQLFISRISMRSTMSSHYCILKHHNFKIFARR